jgi:transposase
MKTSDRVVVLAQQGLPAAAIATKVGLCLGTVYTYIGRARQRGVSVPGLTNTKRSLPLTIEMKAYLHPYARARDVDVLKLAEQILRTVCAHDLVNAVLDDGVKTDG